MLINILSNVFCFESRCLGWAFYGVKMQIQNSQMVKKSQILINKSSLYRLINNELENVVAIETEHEV